jgi:ribose transport system permease protein
MRAVGGERHASRVAGIPVSRTIVFTLTFGGLIAGLGGALHAYSLSAALPEVSFEPLIYGVIAAVIGGVAITGGEGAPVGIALGALSLAFLQEGFTVMGSSANLVTIVVGLVLLLVAIVAAPEVGRMLDLLRPGWSLVRQRAPSSLRR